MIQSPQIQQNIIGFDGFAPGMKTSNASNPLTMMPCQNLKHLLFRFGGVKRPGIQLNVASKIHRSHKLRSPD
jgi:hypothetical protein